MKAITVLSVIVCMTAVRVFAQLDNTPFEQRMSVLAADSAKLFLGVNFLGFGKNNEYFNTTVDGYTLFGYQFNPHLSYHISNNVRLDAGVYLQKDFGNSDYSTVQPTLSLKVKKGDLAFVFGTLENSLSHRLIEPLYDFERALKERLENGIQFLWVKDGLYADVWVDWQNMIYFGDEEQERFVAGMSFNKKILHVGGVSVSVPVQLTAFHEGGQIDVNPKPLTSLLNGAIGIELERQSGSFIRAWGLKSYAVYSRSLGDSLAFARGNALFLNPYLKTRVGLTIMGSYWNSEKFITAIGNMLYPSIVPSYPERKVASREWFMLRFLYDIKVTDGLFFTLRAEPFYDTYLDTIDYSYGFYLNFQQRFFLLNAKNR